MKKLIVMLVALTLTFGSQAQIGRIVSSAVKKGVEKKVEQSVEEKVDNLFGIRKQQPNQPQNQSKEQTSEQVNEEDHIPTPEEIMGMVPALPSFQNLADYACEQHRANPRTLKMMANPTTAFLVKMTAAMASGYVVMMGAGQSGSVYNYDEQLLKELGITQEQFDAMSEEEQQQIATKYAAELQDRYLTTVEKLAADEGYQKLQKQYAEIEEEIQKVYDEADTACALMWKKKYGAKDNPTENDLCGYFGESVPVQYKAVVQAMKMRKARQLPVAKEMDEYVQKLAKKNPKEVFAGFFNQGGMCATAYVGDAARLTSLSDPR